MTPPMGHVLCPQLPDPRTGRQRVVDPMHFAVLARDYAQHIEIQTALAAEVMAHEPVRDARRVGNLADRDGVDRPRGERVQRCRVASACACRDPIHDHSPLQRCFRDMDMLAVHAFLDIVTAAANYGRLVLGHPAEDSLLCASPRGGVPEGAGLSR